MKNFDFFGQAIRLFSLFLAIGIFVPSFSQINYAGPPLTVSASADNMGTQASDAFCNNTGNCFDVNIDGIDTDENTSDGIIGPFNGSGCTNISATFTFSSTGDLERGDDIFLCYRLNLTSTYNDASNNNFPNNAAADTDCGVDPDANDSNVANYNTNAALGGVDNCSADWMNVPIDVTVYNGPSPLGSSVSFQFKICTDYDNTPGKEVTLDQFTITGNGCDFNFNPPLPVELIELNAKNIGDQVQLNWISASEINFSHYEIEHSTNGKAFLPIHKKASTSQDDMSTITKYFWIHKNPSKGSNYYRLKMVDQDDTFEYSRIVEVRYSESEKIRISPNPAEDYFTLALEEDSEYLELRLMDMSGKLVKSWNENVENNQQFSLGDVPNGMYHLICIGDHTQEIVRLVKQ